MCSRLQVVECEFNPERVERSERSVCAGGVAEDGGFGDLEQEPLWREVPFAQGPFDIVGEVWFGEVAGREVDRDREEVAVLFPLFALPVGRVR